MTIRKYEVVGEHADPDDFENYVLSTLGKRESVHISAKRVDIDELAVQRGEKVELLEFDFVVHEIFFRNEKFHFFGGNRLDTKEWLRIEVDDTVRFEVYS